MAAATVGTINPDVFHGQRLNQGTILVIPLTASSADTHQLDPKINPTHVAWHATNAAEYAAVTLAASTGVVTITTDGASDPKAGNLIVFCGRA